LALVKYQARYMVNVAHRAGVIMYRFWMRVSNMFFTCMCVVQAYNMSIRRHISIQNIISYDINVLNLLQNR